MAFYHNLITEKSWQLLLNLRKKYQFILIGGWAVFLYTRALKSKDIDLVASYKQLDKFKSDFEVSKNDRLKKYEARRQEVEIDIYLPYYSNPGLPAEVLENFKINLEGFQVVEKEILAVLKQKAFLERANSSKGRKDLIDLISLFKLSDFDWSKYKKIIARYQLENQIKEVAGIIQQTKQIEELNLNVHQFSRLKKTFFFN